MVNLDKAVVTPCVENGRPDGVRRLLPWTFVRLGAVGEERAYVVPRHPGYGGDGGLGRLAGGGEAAAQTAPESMPFLPFPLESSRPAGTSGSENLDKPGPVAVHFFGFI